MIATTQTITQAVAQNTPYIISGKNVNVYLEDAEFGLPAATFAFNPQTRQLELRDQVTVQPITVQPISQPVATTQWIQDRQQPSLPNNPIRQVSGVLTTNPPYNPESAPILTGYGQGGYSPSLVATQQEWNRGISNEQNIPATSNEGFARVPVPGENPAPRDIQHALVSQPTSYSQPLLPTPVIPAYLNGNGMETANGAAGLSRKEIDDLIDSKASKWAWKKGTFTFTPYGYLNLSAVWESQRTVAGDYCVYAQSPELASHSDRSAFYIDPRSSRIGLKIDAPGPNGWTDSFARGVFECDFQGSYQVRNRSAFMLRKAYMEVGDKKTRFLFGQDWEIFAPLYPMMFNYTAGAGVGNLGYRRAMVRAEHIQDCSSDSTLTWQIGAGDNTLRDYTGTTVPEDPKLTASGWPIIQGRLAYAFGKNTFSTGLPVVFGVSGQIGEQRGDYLDLKNQHNNVIHPARTGDSFRTWAVCLDLDLPLTQKLRLQGELYTGENVSNLEGGIMQGIDLVRCDTIRCQGGWGAIQYAWTKKLKMNLGFLWEDPFDQDLFGTAKVPNTTRYTSRSYSECFFGNLSYNWTDAFLTGLELSQWRTNWRVYDIDNDTFTYKTPGTPFRVEFVARYNF